MDLLSLLSRKHSLYGEGILCCPEHQNSLFTSARFSFVVEPCLLLVDYVQGQFPACLLTVAVLCQQRLFLIHIAGASPGIIVGGATFMPSLEWLISIWCGWQLLQLALCELCSRVSAGNIVARDNFLSPCLPTMAVLHLPQLAAHFTDPL